MIDVVVVVSVPATEKLEPGSGALLSRDRMVEDEPAYTQVFRFEFEDDRALQASLAWLGNQAVSGGPMINTA